MTRLAVDDVPVKCQAAWQGRGRRAARILADISGAGEAAADSVDTCKAVVPAGLGEVASHGPLPCPAQVSLAAKPLTWHAPFLAGA